MNDPLRDWTPEQREELGPDLARQRGESMEAIRADWRRAHSNGHEPPPAASPDDYGKTVQAPIRAPRPLSLVSASSFAGHSVPARRWLVPHRIPLGNVTMLAGDGAAGKTTIALQLAAATVRGTDWLGGVIDQQGPAIFLSAEEDQDEIHRRLSAIVESHGYGFEELASLHLLCMPGEDPILGAPRGTGAVYPTALFESLLASASELRPALIAIEAAADVYAGNENDRSQVRQFIGLLRRLALASGAAVLLIAHPSLSGMASGSGTSGSTAWNNSVRSRLYFTSPKTRDDDEIESDIRELRVMKSNYGPAGEIVRVQWRNGLFVPQSDAPSLARVAAESEIDARFLVLLDTTAAQGRYVSPSPSSTYAPAVFERLDSQIKKTAFEKAMNRLFAANRIKIEEYGPPSRQRQRIARPEAA